ncbi:MAG: hypothetical protein WBI41_02905 [Azovibrio sp.]|uniref:hypothetical protein n=1 Tax=Azovibrio sp. TaxID=1872673 RepID=UPI003C7870AD
MTIEALPTFTEAARQRWESVADRDVVLRSKRPERVEQEFYALLLAHAAIRRLMTQAAAATDQAAGDLSFIHAMRVLKRRLPTSVAPAFVAPAFVAIPSLSTAHPGSIACWAKSLPAAPSPAAASAILAA